MAKQQQPNTYKTRRIPKTAAATTKIITTTTKNEATPSSNGQDNARGDERAEQRDANKTNCQQAYSTSFCPENEQKFNVRRQWE